MVAKVTYVQIDSLALMKIVKHVDSELSSNLYEASGEACQGLLTGLVAVDEDRLEVTNCFPTARPEMNMDNEEGNTQMAKWQAEQEEVKQHEMLDMLRKFRNMNIDYELVGFYQAHAFGACFSYDMAASLFEYQSNVQDGVVLVYDPVKTRQGQLSMNVCRLSQTALDMFGKEEWSLENVKSKGITYENLFEELPLVIKSSHLVNVMVAELSLAESSRLKNKSGFHLQLGTKGSLEKCVRTMVANTDLLTKDIQLLQKYLQDRSRHEAHINYLTKQRESDNDGRRLRGEPALSMDDIRKMKGPTLWTRNGMLDSMLVSLDTQALCDFVNKVTGETMAKLFLAESLVNKDEE